MDSSRLSDYQIIASNRNGITIEQIKQMQIQIMECSDSVLENTEEYLDQLLSLATIINYKMKTL